MTDMTDVTQGAPDAPDDASLFQDATTTTLEKFENPELPIEPVAKEPVKEPVKEPPKEPNRPDPDAMVPAGRLREESEARRRLERERDDLMRQLASRPQPQMPPQPKPDMFENPSGFVQNEVRPSLEQINQRLQMQTEAFSKQMAAMAHGYDKVTAAEQALTQGMRQGDPSVKAVWEQAMQSAHPYEVITRWHVNQETMREVGGDLAAYKKRILEEALKDPEYQRQAIQASKGTAQHVARSVTSSVPKIPSLGNVGAGAGGEPDLQEPSDEQLFRAAVTARRK
jgi:hypothetical protein